jgi:hypothetical protein
VASYFIALVTIYSCFKSTNLAITAGGTIETAEPTPLDISSGLAGFIIISFIADFGYNKFIKEEKGVNENHRT